VVFGVFVVFHVFSMCLFELVGFVSSFGVAIGLFALIYPVVEGLKHAAGRNLECGLICIIVVFFRFWKIELQLS